MLSWPPFKLKEARIRIAEGGKKKEKKRIRIGETRNKRISKEIGKILKKAPQIESRGRG